MGDELVGTWRLVSFVSYRADGREINTFGPRPRGLLMYDPGGHMSVQIASSDRNFSDSDPAIHRDPESDDPLESYFGYFGRYTVNDSTATVTHHVHASSDTGLDRTDQPRRIRWQGDHLVLSTLPDEVNGTGITYVATWQRPRRDRNA